jgi:hypothetical protein
MNITMVLWALMTGIIIAGEFIDREMASIWLGLSVLVYLCLRHRIGEQGGS